MRKITKAKKKIISCFQFEAQSKLGRVGRVDFCVFVCVCVGGGNYMLDFHISLSTYLYFGVRGGGLFSLDV